MYGKWKNAFALTIFLSLSISFSTPLQLQSLSLMQAQPKSLSKPEPQHEPVSNQNGFSMELQLHHVDSLLPDHSTLTPQTLLNLRLQRDVVRVKQLSARAAGFNSPVISGYSQGSRQYFTRIGVGSPAEDLYLVIDTASDLPWVQCAPCNPCYNQTDPIFNPLISKTYLTVNCRSQLCSKLDQPACDRRRNMCLYEVEYSDGSSTTGDLSTETLTFGGQRVERIAFGCGFKNEGPFGRAAGILGLGRGNLSFPVQAGRLFDQKFSYCLVDLFYSNGSSSSIVFGETAVPRKSVFTPLVDNPKQSTFYYVQLEGISVEGRLVSRIKSSDFKIDSKDGHGGVIMDPSTTLTQLVQPAYEAFRDAYRAKMKYKLVPPLSGLDTCYDFSGMKEAEVPTVELHFHGANMSLPPPNYMVPVGEGKWCLAFVGTEDKLSIIGSIQQQGFRVSFDLEKNQVGFAAKSCG